MNRIILSGNLTKTPELKVYQSTTVAKFGIAVKRPFSKNDETDFFNVVAFGKTAELCAKYLEKGRRVIIEGRLQTSNYEDRDGNKRTGYDVIVENLEFADSKKKSADSSPVDDDDDIGLPF